MRLALQLDFGTPPIRYLDLEGSKQPSSLPYARIVDWSSDGSRFLSVCRDNVVRLCELPQDYVVGQVPQVVVREQILFRV
jgi:hypothetical protein